MQIKMATRSFGVWILAGICSVSAAEKSANDVVIVSHCDDLRSWSFSGSGRLKAAVMPDDTQKGNSVLSLSYTTKGSGVATTQVPATAALTRSHVFTFRLRGASPTSKTELWLHLICKNGALFRKQVGIANFEWAEVSFVPKDFVGWDRGPNTSGEPPDWTEIRSVRFYLLEPKDLGTILLDTVAFHKLVALEQPVDVKTAERVVVNNCDQTSSWKVMGQLNVSTSAEDKQEGSKCLSLSYAGKTTGSVTTAMPESKLTSAHMLSFKLRGPSAATKARVEIQLTDEKGHVYRKALAVTNPDWSDVTLVGADFRGSEKLDWNRIKSMTFKVETEDPEEHASILLDAIGFHKLHLTGPRSKNEDKHYWWWDGDGFDPFLGRHASAADWPHREGDPPEHTAPLTFDRFILSPYMRYTVSLHNDKQYERSMLAITDWHLNPIQVINVSQPKKGMTKINLTAPAKTGTYLFNLVRYAPGSTTPERYQTGIMVQAKRLTEPRGIWGLEVAAARSNPVHDTVMDMFQAMGAMCVRFSDAMVNRRSDKYMREDYPRNIDFYRKAKARNIVLLNILNPVQYPEVYRPLTSNQFASAEHIARFVEDVEATTRAFKGLVSWHELGNEMNERALPPYAEVLKKAYPAAKKGDPGCKLIMAGCHVLDGWQKRLWEMEKVEKDQRFKVYQDAVTTHLYPDLRGVEPILRGWLKKIGAETLRAKGNVMTESGWPAMTRKLQDLLRNGFVARDYSGELDTQCWLAMYTSVMLGEHLKMGAALHGVYFFRAVTALKYKYIYNADGTYIAGELAMPSEGYFVNRGLVNVNGDWRISVARPFAYTHATIARLLTHEVREAKVDIAWDKKKGNVESYAFHRPGETILAIWIGTSSAWQNRPRAKELAVSVTVPDKTGLVLAVDLMGNERVLKPDGNQLKLLLTRPPDVRDGSGQRILYLRSGQPIYLRFLQGEQRDNVFLQNIQQLPKTYRLLKGTPDANPELARHISEDRDLPVINDVVPEAGSPLVLYSKPSKILYVVGRTDSDVTQAERALRQFIDSDNPHLSQ